MNVGRVSSGIRRNAVIAALAVARTLVHQTALRAAHTAADPAPQVAALRRSVTSPGGTRAAALAVLEQAGLADILRRALTAARGRGIELGRGPR